MKCSKECSHWKENDAVREMEDGVKWYCDMPHSQCEDLTCLLRMVIWELSNLTNSMMEPVE